MSVQVVADDLIISPTTYRLSPTTRTLNDLALLKTLLALQNKRISLC